MFDVYVSYLARTTAFFHLAPVISDGEVPERTRLALAALVAALLLPANPPPVGSLPIRLALETLVGATLGGMIALVWRTLEATLAPLAGAPDQEELAPLTSISRWIGLACFLALSGDHHLIRLLALEVPRDGVGRLAAAGWFDAGTAVFSAIAATVLPLLLSLALAQVVAALVLRGAPLDLSGVTRPLLVVFAVLLAAGWAGTASGFYEGALSAPAWTAAARPAPQGGSR